MDFLLALFPSCRLLVACAAVVKYKMFGNAMSASGGQPDRGNVSIVLLKDDEINGVRENAVGTTHREVVEANGPGPRCTLSEYC